MPQLDKPTSERNYKAFLWHAVFLALTTNFMDIDTVIPSMLLKAGGNAIHIGIVTAILLGGTSFFQLLFSGFLARSSLKKKFLLMGINLRIFALLALGSLLFWFEQLDGAIILLLVFLFISIFSVSGAFANVSYVDIIGKSMFREIRKKFFSLKQLISGIGIFLSALVVREILKQFNYPVNYGLLFAGAGVLLLVASLGFWRLRETGTLSRQRIDLLTLFKSIPSEIRNNTNLRYYIILINSLGLGISLLPFLVVFAQDKFGLTDVQVGNYLFFRVSGMVVMGFLLYWISSRFIYKQVMAGSLIIGSLIPVIALILASMPQYFQYLFILNGFFFTTYKVAQDGILIEISEEGNRAFYTGIAGASNLSIILFPLIAGFLIRLFDYVPVFIGISTLILASLVYAFKLDCTQKPEYGPSFNQEPLE